MKFNDLARSAALKVPRLRRVHDHLLNLIDDNARLREQLAAAQQQVGASTGTAAADALSARIYVLTSDLQRVVAALDHARTESDGLKDERAALHLELTHTASTAAAKEADHEQQLQASETAKRERQALDARLYVLTSDHQRAVASLDVARTELHEIRQRSDAAHREVMERDTALEAALKAAADAQKRVEVLEGTHSELQELRQRSDAAERELTKRDMALEVALKATAEAQKRVEALASAHNELQEFRHRADVVQRELLESNIALEVARRHANEAMARADALEVHRPSLPDVAALSQRLAALSDLMPQRETLIELEGKLMSRLSVLGYDVTALQRLMDTKAGTGDASALRNRYLDLLQASLVGLLSEDANMAPWGDKGFDPDRRFWGRDWPASAQTMIGVSRMRNIRALVEQALADNVPGDLLEAGVWRGGACIYMRGILEAHGVADRKVWVADSFAGLPKPDEKRYPADRNDAHHTFEDLVVSLEDVKRSFERYGLLDEGVGFLPGWFKDTLPGAPVARLAMLRLDGDMYGSTMEALEALYPRVAPGGFVVIDDYILKPCAKATDDYRRRMGVREPLVEVDGAAVYWRKS